MTAQIDITNTAPAAKSFAFLAKGFTSGEAKSTILSKAELNNSLVQTPAIARLIQSQSTLEKFSKLPDQMTAIVQKA